jgi:hypothetical protein
VKKLLRKRTLLVVVSSVAVVVAALGTSAALGDDPPNPPRGDALVADINSQIGADPNKSQDIGQVSRIRKGVFAFGAGDPVDVDLLAGKGGVRCLAVSGEAYPSSVGCFLMKDAAKDGSYQVVMPLGDAPVLVVGYAPNGKSRVEAKTGPATGQGVVRDQVFMATLAPGALGHDNAAKVTVVYGS